MSAKRATVPVSERALLQRINRKLRQQGKMLKVTRGERAAQDLGRCYIVNVNQNYVVSKDCDPEDVGRELGVLADYEHAV